MILDFRLPIATETIARPQHIDSHVFSAEDSGRYSNLLPKNHCHEITSSLLV